MRGSIGGVVPPVGPQPDQGFLTQATKNYTQGTNKKNNMAMRRMKAMKAAAAPKKSGMKRRMKSMKKK